MKQIQNEVLFDHYLTEQLGFWLRYSPAVPLPLPVFYNLLSSDVVLCFDEHLYPEEIERGPWKKELREIIKIGKIRVLPRKFEIGDEMQIDRFQLDLCPLGRFEDTLSLLWCARQDVPFRISERAADHLNYIVEKIGQFLETVKWPLENSGSGINACLKWIVDVEVPELERRSQRQRKETFKENVLVVQGNPDMTYILAESFWESLENSVFVTPPELLALLEKREQLRALREMLSRASSMNLTKPDIHALLREHWDSLLGRIEIADLTFTGLDVALIPLQLSGLVTKPLQLVVNHFIRRQENWLLSLNSFNKHLRKMNEKRDG